MTDRPDRRSTREKHIQYILGRCKHFTGVSNPPCGAGINYDDLLGTGPGCWAHIPCSNDPESPVQCDKREFLTREEAETEATEWEAKMNRTLTCLSAAHDHAKSLGLGKGHGGRGSLDCPSGCGGILYYSVAGLNGHMHAKCNTEGCVSWME